MKDGKNVPNAVDAVHTLGDAVGILCGHVKTLTEALETAIRWLRRLEAEYPGCLNEDAIEKHLESALQKTKGITLPPKKKRG